MKRGELVKCNSCGGIYAPIQHDGTEYHHVCPTRRVVGAEPAPTKDDPAATRPVFAAIANRRDERVVGYDVQTKVTTIVSDGGGVTPLTADETAAFRAALEE